jgi:hypothetical protein
MVGKYFHRRTFLAYAGEKLLFYSKGPEQISFIQGLTADRTDEKGG